MICNPKKNITVLIKILIKKMKKKEQRKIIEIYPFSFGE